MDIDRILQSVVTVRTSIPDDAFTAPMLGTRREGSGVVIRENGLVLTIGYLVTEAEEVWLTSNDGRLIPAHALAYDQETGFGLVQALGDLKLPALDLGDAAKAKIGDPVVLADGMNRSVQASIVAKQEFAGYWEYLLDDAIFIAPAHPSWGGAALVGADGKLLGIGSLRLQMSRGGENADINMVVPIDLLPPILDDLHQARPGEQAAAALAWGFLGRQRRQGRGHERGRRRSGCPGRPAAGRHHLRHPRWRSGRPRRFLPQALEQRPGGNGAPDQDRARRP